MPQRREPKQRDTAALPLPGMPVPPPPPPTARDLVAAWCDGWSESHGGRLPDASVIKRVAGVCRNVARDRTDLDSWRAAWRAARTAGGEGSMDVVRVLAAPAVGGRGNHHLTVATGGVSMAEQVTAMLHPAPMRELGA